MSRRILVADDNQLTLEFLRRTLTHPGGDIFEAASGAELVQLLAEHGRFDLIVTDITMGWMTGLQVILSARRAGIDTPVVVITGTSDLDLKQKVEALGNARLLRKPFGRLALLTAVQEVMHDAKPFPAGGPVTDLRDVMLWADES